MNPDPGSGSGGGLLQISDPHFGTEQPGAPEALLELAARLRPALVVLSGDVTQRATAAQFATARRFVQALAEAAGGAPLLAIPGNHDIPLLDPWSRLLHPYARWEAAFGKVQDVAVAAAAGWHVVALNTTRRWRHKNGEVSTQQVARASAHLQTAAPDAIRIVVTHQPVAVPRPSERPNLLRGASAAVAAWHAAGADLVLGGHIHLPCVLPLRPAPRPMWALQAGTALSSRVRPAVPNSVSELQVAPGGCRLRFWDWVGPGQDFVARPSLELQLAARSTR